MKIMAYDVETTGTNPGQYGIHQIAGIILIDGKEKERFEIKLRPNPKAKIDPEALKAANVTEEQIMAYPPMEEGYRELIKILGRYVDKFNKQDKFFLLGYNNAGFDDNFLRGLFLQNGDQYFGSWFWADPMDVRVLAIRQLAPVRHLMENFKLMTVARQVGIEVDESRLHDAVYDVELTYEIFKRLRLTKTEIEELHGDFQKQEAIQLAYEQLELIEPIPTDDPSNSNLENLQIAMNILRKFIKPAVTACLILWLAVGFSMMEAQAQFKEKGPKGDALRYNGWLQKQHSFKGYRPTNKEIRNMGMKPSEVRRKAKELKSNSTTILNTQNHEKTSPISHALPLYRLEHVTSPGRQKHSSNNRGIAFSEFADCHSEGIYFGRQLPLCDCSGISGILYPDQSPSESAGLLREDQQYHILTQRPSRIHFGSRKAQNGGNYDRAGWEILPYRLPRSA